MKKKLKRIWIAVAAIVIVAALGAGYMIYSGGVSAANAQADQPEYQTGRVQKGDLTAAIGATGTVRSKQKTVLTWQTTGVIASLNAAKGQKVAANTVLAELDQTSLPQNIILAQANLVAAQKALDTLQSSSSAQAAAQLSLVAAQKGLDDAKQHRLNLSYRATPDQIAAANANYIMAQNLVDDKQELYDRVAGRPENDNIRAISLANLENAKKARDKALINLNWYKGKADPKDIAQADAAIAVAQAKMDDAQREWDRLKDGPDPRDITAAEAQVAAAQATLNLARISAPFSGTVTNVYSKLGDQVAPGALAFQIDDLSHLYVDVDVSEVDIAKIKLGQPVSLTLDALEEQEFAGLVDDIASSGTPNSSGTVNFVTTIEITGPSGAIKPGMTATASIVTSQVKQALLVPTRAIYVRPSGQGSGKHYVNLLKNGQAVPVEVAPGSSSNTLTEVTSSGLHEGDLVILNATVLP